MSTVIESTIKKFEGKIYLPEYLTLPQVLKFMRAQDDLAAALVKNPGMKVWDSYEILCPAIFACIERLDIVRQPTNPTLDTFRFSPAEHGGKFLELLINEVTALAMVENEVPKD